MEKYICLRDDDTNYYTSAGELKDAYGMFWGELPVTLAAVPFEHGSEWKILDMEEGGGKYQKLRQWEKNASEEELTEYHKVCPIGENKELTDELKKLVHSGKAEIAQHGVHHRYNEFGAEMVEGQVLIPEIQKGREYLEKVFETKIVTFVPPANWIDVKCAKAVNACGMNLFSSGSLVYKNKAQMIWEYMTHPQSVREKIQIMVKPAPAPILSRAGIYRFPSFTFDTFKDQAQMYRLIAESLHKTGFAALGTHYRLFKDEDYAKKYRRLLEKLTCIKGVNFVTARDYFRLLMDRYY